MTHNDPILDSKFSWFSKTSASIMGKSKMSKTVQKSSSLCFDGTGLYRSQHITRVDLIIDPGNVLVVTESTQGTPLKKITNQLIDKTWSKYLLWRSLKHFEASSCPFGFKTKFGYDKSCDVKDLTADQFDIYVPQLWYPADPSRYDRSGSSRSEFETVCFNTT